MKTLTLLAAKVAAILRHDEQGVTSVEYGLMVGLIAFVIIGAVALFGQAISQMFTSLAGSLP